MANSPLLGGERAAERPRGTSTDLLGPSDTSDSGSDITGAVGAVETDELGFDGGSNDDIRRAPGAGADIGDADLDGGSDSGGTGERAEAGRDTLREEAPDIMPDRVIGIGSDEAAVAGEFDELAADADSGDDADELAADDGTEDSDAAPRPPAGSAARQAPRGGENRPRAAGEKRVQDPVSERDKSIDA
ncbi:hypothetical protein [Ideonella sp. BN130291]|uniref:hypothetical protein n=1 Tax=Ideonella sp. BN130291 TaxID=3112940 RepID=UPI002E261BDD|nr:hypothetical protein [Ideonella sp. BN130291]